MSAQLSDYRLDGIYVQRQSGFFMQRVKLPAGVVSAGQARAIAAVAAHFGQGTIHLTTRGSMEIHWLKEDDLAQVKRELAKAGLTSRGACGGAVRGITCGSQGVQGFPLLESLARRLHRHFTGNPRFERLPKKFKIGLEADSASGRHLIQDVGLVMAKNEGGQSCYDIWVAGGLGREPRPGFLLFKQVTEERIIPIIEAILTVYAAHAPPPKRLKFLASEFGEAKLRQLIEAEDCFGDKIPPVSGLTDNLITEADGRQRLELPVFAGRLTAEQLTTIAAAADTYADGVLMVTSDQDIAMLLLAGVDAVVQRNTLQLLTGLASYGFTNGLRVCPGSHECRMGLTATIDLAHELVAQIGAQGRKLSWAVSGCSNSCTQPQLADVGIMTARQSADEDGQKTARFDVYRRIDTGLGQKVHIGLTKTELIEALQSIE